MLKCYPDPLSRTMGCSIGQWEDRQDVQTLIDSLNVTVHGKAGQP